MSLYLTMTRRQNTNKMETLQNAGELAQKPRMRFIHSDGSESFLLLKKETSLEKPRFSVIIDGEKYYPTNESFVIDYFFPTALNGILNLKSNGKNISIETDTTKISASSGFSGGALAPNGKIYFSPSSSRKFLEIDPKTNTALSFGSLAESSVSNNLILGKNGKLFTAPSLIRKIYACDPETKEITSPITTFPTDAAYAVALGKNDKIYYAYYGLYELDTNTNTTTELATGNGFKATVSMTFGADGKLYSISRLRNYIGEYDVEDHTSVSYSNPTQGTWGNVLAPNGKIYGIPYNATKIVKFDPVEKTIETIGDFSTNWKWTGGVLAPNGKIYAIPYEYYKILEIDPATDTVTEFQIPFSTAYKGSIGSVLAPNGKIYGCPYEGSDIVVLDCGNITSNSLLSPYFNKM